MWQYGGYLLGIAYVFRLIQYKISAGPLQSSILNNFHYMDTYYTVIIQHSQTISLALSSG